MPTENLKATYPIFQSNFNKSTLKTPTRYTFLRADTEQWFENVWRSSKQQNTLAYSPLFEYKKSTEYGKGWSVLLIYFSGHGVLRVEQFYGIYSFILKVRKQIQSI